MCGPENRRPEIANDPRKTERFGAMPPEKRSGGLHKQVNLTRRACLQLAASSAVFVAPLPGIASESQPRFYKVDGWILRHEDLDATRLRLRPRERV